MKTKIIPLYDRVLLRPKEITTNSAGIYVPVSQTERSQTMIVVASGDGRMDDGTQVRMFLRPDDVVLVSKYAGTEVAADEKLFILKQCDILAKVGEME